MTSVSVRVEGLGRVLRSLERLGVEVEDLKDGLGRIGTEAMPVYQALTPVRSGRLRGDYRVSRAKGRVNLYVGRASVPHAGPINYGWPARGIRASNFVERGDRVAAPRATASLETEIGRLIANLGLT